MNLFQDMLMVLLALCDREFIWQKMRELFHMYIMLAIYLLGFSAVIEYDNKCLWTL